MKKYIALLVVLFVSVAYAVTKQKPLKVGTVGMPVEIDASVDYLAAKGIAFTNSDNTLIDEDSGSLKFWTSGALAGTIDTGGDWDLPGHVAIGGNASVNSNIVTYVNETASGAVDLTGVNSIVATDNVDSSANGFFSLAGTVSVVGASAKANNAIAVTGDANNDSGAGAGAVTTLAGGSFSANHTGSSTVANMYGVLGAITMDNSFGSPIATQAMALRGTITKTGGTITTAYGLYLDPVTAGATNYSIVSTGGDSLHAGKVRIGTVATPPTNTLDVTGTFGTTSTATIGSLTNTRVVFSGSGGLLSDDADLTFATDTLTATKLNSTQIGTASNGVGVMYFDESGAGTETVAIQAPTLTGNNTQTLPSATGTLINSANNVSALASSTSANLATLLSDETGTGVAVFGTSPRLTTSILDSNGNELFGLTATASAVNEFTVANAATGNAPTLSATGNDASVSLQFATKGTPTNAGYRFAGNSAQGASIGFGEDTDNGTDQTIIRFPSSVGVGGYTYAWPTADGVSGTVLTTSGSGTLTWSAVTVPADKKTYTFSGGDASVGGSVTTALDMAGVTAHGLLINDAITCTDITMLLDSNRTAGTATANWAVNGVNQTGSCTISTATDRCTGTMSVNVASGSVITISSTSASFTPTGADVAVFLVCQEQ